MIIINWFISNVPTSVFVFGSSSANPGPYLKPYDIWERVQLSLYFVQELIISGVYIYEVRHILQDKTLVEAEARKKSVGSIFSVQGLGRRWKTTASRLVLKHLILINLLIVVLDVSLLVAEYIGHYEIQVVYKVCNSIMPWFMQCEELTLHRRWSTPSNSSWNSKSSTN